MGNNSFFKKLNNSHVIAGLCLAIAFVLALAFMIDLVADPFIQDMTYTARIDEQNDGGEVKISAKLTLLEDGRYKLTIRDRITKEKTTTFGDYSYGKVVLDETLGRQNVISFDGSGYIAQKNPFKLEFDSVKFTNGGAIFLLVLYIFLILVFASCSILLLVKYKSGNPVFGTKMRLSKRVKELEDMLGINRK